MNFKQETRKIAELLTTRPHKSRLKQFKEELNKDFPKECEIAKSDISHFYFEEGYGLKLVARELGISYSYSRSLFKILEIEFRKGQDIVPDRIRNFRSEKAKKENFGKNVHNRKIREYTGRGVQGYYWNHKLNKYCWLRSSYEYIFAKWLDSKGILWDTEIKYLQLENGEKYLPDFFIYRDFKEEPYQIVEIKSDYAQFDRGKHFQIKNKNVEVVLVNDIKNYLPEKSSLGKELTLWKKIRKSQK